MCRIYAVVRDNDSSLLLCNLFLCKTSFRYKIGACLTVTLPSCYRNIHGEDRNHTSISYRQNS